MKRALMAIWLLIVCIAGGYVCLRVHDGLKFRTDLMALLPHEEQDPILQYANDAVTKSLSQRILMLAGHENREQARAAATALSNTMGVDGVVSFDGGNLSSANLRAMGEFYFPYREGLLNRADRAALLAGQGANVAAGALSKVYGLVGMANAKLLKTDPFLLMPGFFSSLPVPLSRLSLDEGMLSTVEDGKTWILITAKAQGDVFALETQEKIASLYDAAKAKAQAVAPGAEILHLGAVFFAGEGAKRAMDETSTIGIASTIGTALLTLAVFRAFAPLWQSLLVVGVGVVVALAGSLVFFGELHVGALLFGVSLIGIAVDYCLQYSSEIFAPEVSTPQQRLERVQKAIVVGAATSIIGYLTLYLAPFPGLRQITVFSVIGLTASCITVLLWQPAIDRSKPPTHSPKLLAYSQWVLDFWLSPVYRRMRTYLLAGMVVLCVAGFMRFHTDDNVRNMQSLSAPLAAEQEQVQKRIGTAHSNQFFLVQAPDAQTALQREEALTEKLLGLVEVQSLAGFLSPADYVPSIHRQTENRKLVRKALYPLLDKHLETLQLRSAPELPKADAPFLTLDSFAGKETLFSYLLLPFNGNETLHIVMLEGVKNIPALIDAAKDIPGVRLIDPAGDFSALLGKYRWRALSLAALSALLIAPLLLWQYGLKGGFWVILPPTLAMLLTPALAALLGNSFTFFDAFGLVLVLALGVDYTVFYAETSDARLGVTLLAVTLSALTTMLSFGLLGLSAMLPVHNFGVTLLIGTILAFWAAPLARHAAKEK